MQAIWIALSAVVALAASVSVRATEPDGALAALEQARAARLEGNLEAAADVLERFLGERGALTAESSSALHRELGDIRLLQGRGGAAASQFEAALKARPGQAAVHYQAGIAYRAAGLDSKAASHLQRGVELGFRTTSALLHLSGAQFGSGHFSSGLRISRELLDSRPTSSKVFHQLGRQLFTYLFYRDALRAFEAALALEPESYEARFFLALTNHLLNRHQEVERLLATPAGQVPTAESAVLLASAMATLGRIPEAKALLVNMIDTYPASPHAYLNLSLLLLEEGLTDEAEQRLEALHVLDAGESPKVFYEIRRNSCSAIANRLRGEKRTLRKNPGRADAYFEMARSLASRHHHGTAVEVLRLARRYEGNSPRTLQALAYSCLHLEPHGAAPVRMLEELLRLDPGRGDAHHLLGRAYLRQGRVEAAIASHRAAVAIAPNSPEFLTELGRALSAVGDDSSRAAAIDAFSEASEAGPGNAVARYELGKLLVERGKLIEARRVLEEAVEAEPEFHNAYYALGQVLIRTGQTDRARAFLELFREKKAAVEARSTVTAGFASAN